MQQRQEPQQGERLEIRHGRLRIKEWVFEVPPRTNVTASVTAAGRSLRASMDREGREVRLALEEGSVVPEGAARDAALCW